MSSTPQLQAQTLRIEQLVARALDGALRIPDFQRRIKWRSRDVLLLFDSITKGFPIGTLLLSFVGRSRTALSSGIRRDSRDSYEHHRRGRGDDGQRGVLT